MYKVNVEGTKTMVRASQETGVKAFVYTSSASIIHDTRSNLICADETYPIIMGKDQPQYYTTTKAQAEMHVLASNRTASHPNFLTAAIRPSAMFGAGDVQLLPPMMASYYRGQAKFQLGNNENLFDYTEITNIAHAHHLALAALLATHERSTAGQAIPLEHERVDGEAFLITNDQPVYFFDFARRCWAEMGDATDALIALLDASVAPPPQQVRFETKERLPLADFPLPAYEKIPLRHYLLASIQFSSGCPYRCEFCDIPALYGRQPRLKSPDPGSSTCGWRTPSGWTSFRRSRR